MRSETWERDLATYLAAQHARPFQHGTHDCALFAAGAVMAMTGDDPAKAFRGRYKSQASAVRALRTIGAGDLESTITDMFERVEPAFAQRGDLIWNGEAVGVCDGAGAWFVGAEGEREGMVSLPRWQWRGAWRV